MGIEQPRVRCGSVFTWNTEGTCRGFTMCREVIFGICWIWFILAKCHLSLRGRVGKAVVVASLVLFFRCPHSRVCLGGAIWQCGVNRVIFCLVTLGENKCLILWTWKMVKETRVQAYFSISESDFVPDEDRTYRSCYLWSWSQVQGCTGRTQMCFSVSSSILFPPDRDSACDSLSHSLWNRHGWKLWTNRRMYDRRQFMEYSLTLTVVALFDHSPQLQVQIWFMWVCFMPMMIDLKKDDHSQSLHRYNKMSAVYRWFHGSCVRHWSCSLAWHISTFPWWSKRWFLHDWFARP